MLKSGDLTMGGPEMIRLKWLGVAVATFVSMPAMAADLPVKARPAPVVPIAYDWTGFYIGAHAGGAWFNKDWSFPCSPTNAVFTPCGVSEGGHSGSGWLAGGQVGFNYQISQWVWGVEAQFSATRIDGSNISPPFPGDTLHSRSDFIGTIAGRVGVAWDRTLLYAKGGGAWVHDKYWEVDSAGAFSPVGTVFAEADEVRWGWMVGAGIEYAFAPNWSAKVEYNYLDLGTRRIAFSPTVANQSAFEEDIRQRVQLVKVGVNYKFDWGRAPVAARY
jgi:outer membrane immunogenic protein